MPIAGGSCCRTVRCCIFRCPYIALYFLATGFTVLLFLAYLWDNHENHKNEELYNFLSRKSNFENLACNGQGVGIKPIAPVNTSVVRRSRTGEKPKCEFIKQPLQTLELNSPEIIVDNENDIFHTIMHPKKISSNLLHNFAPVYAPGSSLSIESGFPWWGIAGIDGRTAANRYKLGIHLLRSKDGIDWEPVYDRHAILKESDIKYFKAYHSAFDGQNRIIYDKVLNMFFIFTRANVGKDARSFQRAVSRDLACFTDMVPIKTILKYDFLSGQRNGEQFYTHSVFQLPEMYPGVFFAVPRRQSCVTYPG